MGRYCLSGEWKRIRKRIYEIIEIGNGDDTVSKIYDAGMMITIITMVSSLFGVGIIALPAGIITAGYMEELNYFREDQADNVK